MYIFNHLQSSSYKGQSRVVLMSSSIINPLPVCSTSGQVDRAPTLGCQESRVGHGTIRMSSFCGCETEPSLRTFAGHMEGLIAMVEISQTNKGTKSIAQTRRSRRYVHHCINTPGFHAYYMKTRFIQACLNAAKAGEDSSQMQRWTCGATKPSQHLATAFRLQRSSIQFHLQLLRCP